MKLEEDTKAMQVISSYEEQVASRLLELRELIITTAKNEGVDKLAETLKWGEPSYQAPKGSPIRIDWKQSTPNMYYLYFVCTTRLVSTFKLVFGDELSFEGNRAIRLSLHEPLPIPILQRCISLALRYHQLKHLPLLGA